MQLHELLTETARRFRDGEYLWSQHAMAYHVPDSLPTGDVMVRARPVPTSSAEANCFCGVGGILRTWIENVRDIPLYLHDNAHSLEQAFPEMAGFLARAIGVEPKPETYAGNDFDTSAARDLMPFINFNDGYGVIENVTKDDVIAALERAAVLATPPDPED